MANPSRQEVLNALLFAETGEFFAKPLNGEIHWSIVHDDAGYLLNAWVYDVNSPTSPGPMVDWYWRIADLNGEPG